MYKHNFTNIAILVGTADLVCDMLAHQRFLMHKLKYKLKEPTKPWIMDGSFAGMASHFENGIRFYTIHGAGHLTSLQKPLQTLAIFKEMLGFGKIA